MWGEYDQSTLNACIKMSQMNPLFCTIKYANKNKYTTKN
jgi:hypothetical protein